MKKKIYTLSVLLAAVLPAGAQSIKSDINTVLNDIALPVFLGVMVMALAVGIGKNWRLINDERRTVRQAVKCFSYSYCLSDVVCRWQGSSIRMPQGRSTGRRIGRRRLQTVM